MLKQHKNGGIHEPQNCVYLIAVKDILLTIDLLLCMIDTGLKV